MGSSVRTRRRSRMTSCSIMAMLLMTLLLAESGAEVAGFDARGEVESARVVASGRESSRALPTGRVFTLASGPSRKGPGH
ncbi:hypothetical protein NL676_013629 [Syzygium grande]|nr:hypothetical protein NL676_013629 [Syzygium grande]